MYGGQSKEEQLQVINKGLDVLIATPGRYSPGRLDSPSTGTGRLLEFLQADLVELSCVKYFVMDEADRMLSEGFESQLSSINAALPSDKQSILISATFPEAVDDAARRWLDQTRCIRFRVGTKPVSISSGVTQNISVCAGSEDITCDLLVIEFVDSVWLRQSIRKFGSY